MPWQMQPTELGWREACPVMAPRKSSQEEAGHSVAEQAAACFRA